MSPDEPEEQKPSPATPDPAAAEPTREQSSEPASGDDPELSPGHGYYADLSELPPPPPQVSLISDDDLSWLDRPQKTDEEIERRQERKEAHKRKVRRKRRGRRALKITGVVIAFLVVLGLIGFELTFSGLRRMPEVAGQAGLNTPGTNYLLVGANPEEPDAESVSGSGYKHDLLTSDMVMLLHITRDKHSMFAISIPADSELPIPGRGEGKLADAYLAGGAPLYVKTIESWTGVRLDHVAVMDMNALRVITDQLGGVVLTVPRAACGVPAGLRRLDGRQALEYTALQPCLPRMDLDRVERQQSLLRAIMKSAVDGGRLANPLRLQKILKGAADNLTLEKGFSFPGMFATVLGMRHLRTSNTTFLTVPVADSPLARVGGTNVVRLDPTGDAALWEAVRNDQVAAYLATSGSALVLP
ncbi:MAG: LCP family protein [Marmoricola sp.]